MKKLLFIGFVLCLLFLVGCKQAEKADSAATEKTSDVVVKESQKQPAVQEEAEEEVLFGGFVEEDDSVEIGELI